MRTKNSTEVSARKNVAALLAALERAQTNPLVALPLEAHIDQAGCPRGPVSTVVGFHEAIGRFVAYLIKEYGPIQLAETSANAQGTAIQWLEQGGTNLGTEGYYIHFFAAQEHEGGMLETYGALLAAFQAHRSEAIINAALSRHYRWRPWKERLAIVDQILTEIRPYSDMVARRHAAQWAPQMEGLLQLYLSLRNPLVPYQRREPWP